ncbi:response regulator transcription factor [Paenibacillus flagellatus]|uniref:DNA-binding response regulator n=1 Tax=Paenibacillus flagellatus TaxID=2211139 RepID=A0A2V5K910_9BACL|nr:response regulator [Paenibacillus flagellatus]PYI54323.1 DNA-binding response regulator [Paenibacillus flagellatus]
MYRILIVDDEPMIRKGLEKLIVQTEGFDCSVRTAENGEEALERIREERPDFVFTDIRMPRMDGLELCRRLAEAEPDVQVVVVSGYGDFEYARKCVSYGVKEYLLKPVGTAEVRDILAKLAASREKKRSSVYLSVAKLDEWVERMELAVWSLQADELETLLERLKRDYDFAHLTVSRQNEALQELYALLVKKLVQRDVVPADKELKLEGIATSGESFAKLEEAVRQVFRDLKAKRKGKARNPVEAAKAFIDDHLAKDVSLEEVADMLGLNPSYFSQLFKQSTDETFVQYRTRRRMEKAKRLLEQPHYRITDISYEVGYADHPHFTKMFKKHTGLSPSEYRSSLGID